MKIQIISGEDGEPRSIAFCADFPVEVTTAIASISSNFLGLTVNGRRFSLQGKGTDGEIIFVCRD